MKKSILALSVFSIGVVLTSCRDTAQQEPETVVEKEVIIKEETPEKTVVAEEDKSLLEEAASEVDKEVDKEISEEIDKIGNDN